MIVKIDEKLGLTEENIARTLFCEKTAQLVFDKRPLLPRWLLENIKLTGSIYVVDLRQALHLQQAFSYFQLWGLPQSEKCYHLDTVS
ncbi:MAG: hypothetical protein IPL71_24795 [Anaerolineales bacterium]|uniref:hypothetical protein n=1 Tax=Candidatus Villigracilis proximus TaxID=3140683 RepID=UPI003136AC39|nr:hypothetical protein [Anaerolineales bacterium]